MAATSTPTARPAVGQVWRNRRSDRLVVIDEIAHLGNIRWRALTGRGQKTGQRWPGYWAEVFEYVAASEQEVPLEQPVQ